MINSEKTTAAAGTSNMSSFKHTDQIPPSSTFRKKTQKSMFGATAFSGNTENVIQDVNYNVKGTNDNQQVAWEIKFQDSILHDETLINTSEDFIQSELKKHRDKKDKSPLIKQFRKGLKQGHMTNPATEKRKMLSKVKVTPK